MKRAIKYNTRTALLSGLLTSLIAVLPTVVQANVYKNHIGMPAAGILSKIGEFGQTSAPRKRSVTLKQARATALRKYPGKVESEEMEVEKGIRVYSFDIRNRKGSVTEVWVSVKTGKIIHTSIENAAAERKERIADKRKPRQ